MTAFSKKICDKKYLIKDNLKTGYFCTMQTITIQRQKPTKYWYSAQKFTG